MMPDYRQTQKKDVVDNDDQYYEILPSSAILSRLQKLVATYPTFATLTTTQEWVGLPRAGTFMTILNFLCTCCLGFCCCVVHN